MSKLQDLIGLRQPTFTDALRRLERSTGSAGVDVRLIADITTAAHRVMRELGLDPSDTTAHELYGALSARGTAKLLEHTAYVGVLFADGPVSFNFTDVQENRGRVYEQRCVKHMRDALGVELVARYEAHARTDPGVVRELLAGAGVKQPTKSAKAKKTMTKSDKKTPHILCVGDIITDAFIKLSEDFAEVTTDKKGYKRLSFELGAKIPYDDVDIVEAVECSPNAAVSITRLGLDVSLMSWLGDDEPGKGMVHYLEEQGVDTSELVIEKGMKSNYHYVLRYGADRTKLQKFEDYAYKWHAPKRKPDWLYLGVLGEKTWPLHEAMLQYLEANPDVKLIFQPGMYHLMWGAKKLKKFYEHANIVIMNREEAAQVTGKDRREIPELLQGLHDLGVNVAVVTDGPDGAYASDGTKALYMPNYPDPKPPLDRTGAGDAFASTIAAALALDEPLEIALEWAPINSMSVVQQMGAQAGLLTRPELEKYLSKAPKTYRPKEL